MRARCYGALVTPDETLARAVRLLRRERGLTQPQLAAKAGIGEATVKRIERGDGARRSTVRALARALGVRESELIEGVRPPPQEVLELIDTWVEGERVRPRLDPPATEEEIGWLRSLAGEVWSALPLTETTIESLVRAHRSRLRHGQGR